MNEKEWTAIICNKLRESLSEENIMVKTQQRIPYEKEIFSFSTDWEANADKSNKTQFETDLIIYEKKEQSNQIEGYVPRVVIEAKYKGISTHSAIAYSVKAKNHKKVMPYLRYGIMIGCFGNRSLPWRLIQHGDGFDFTFCFREDDPTKKEWEAFLRMVKDEISASKLLEKLYSGKRKKKRVFMLYKSLEMKEDYD